MYGGMEVCMYVCVSVCCIPMKAFLFFESMVMTWRAVSAGTPF